MSVKNEIPTDNKQEKRSTAMTRTADVPENVIESLNEGNHAAFEYIYLHYFDSLRDFIHVLLRSREEAEEIAQEVFMSLWSKRGIFDPRKGIKRYLYQLAKFHSLNHFDKKKVKEKYENFQSRGEIYDLAADDIVQSNETALLIEITIHKMPPRQREVFKMSREQDMSYEEISTKLGISKNKVRNYISASLKELREILSVFMMFLFI